MAQCNGSGMIDSSEDHPEGMLVRDPSGTAVVLEAGA